ncbi:MAG: hypothetical protein U0802_14735 [Candidatus Binatia bacterium]
MKSAAGNAGNSCVTGNDGWISSNAMFDRDVFGAGDHGDYGLSLFGTGGASPSACRWVPAATPSAAATTSPTAPGIHVAATRSAGGALQLFVDGQLDASDSGPAGDVSYADGRTATLHPDSRSLPGDRAEKHDAGAAFLVPRLDRRGAAVIIRYTRAVRAPDSAVGDRRRHRRPVALRRG